MNTFSLLLRRPLEFEQAFRLQHYAAMMCRLMTSDVFESNLYLIEYAQLRVLWPSSAAKLENWCVEHRIDPEKTFCHRANGARALDHLGLYMANIGDNDFREWAALAIKQHANGEFYFGRRWPRLCNAVMVDVPIAYAKTDPYTSRACETKEYLNDSERYERDSIAFVMQLQNRVNDPTQKPIASRPKRVAILPNLTAPMYVRDGKLDPLMKKVDGALIEVGINLRSDSWKTQMMECATFASNWPMKSLFVGIHGGLFDEAATCAAVLEAANEHVYIAHNYSNFAYPNMDPAPIWEWNYNPLLGR